MFFRCEVAVLMLALTLDGQVHTGEVIGGREAQAHSRPYMVLLQRHMQDSRIKHCGGFLLSEDYVMTAAHCQAKTFNVLLGLHDIHNRVDVQSLSVEQSFPHKGYNVTDLRNDIMLLKLSSKAQINNNVNPIALAGQDDFGLPESCSVSGWGRTENSPYMSVKLMEVNVTLIEDQRCPKQRFYCSEGETGPGEGDSGGPLVCEGMAYGVVSGKRKTTSKYTKIPDYRDWADCVMKNKAKC
ncbi:granzyme B-like [Parambassis ranga]|uniref:trypsin n=1 Tax=Parambassis ranga TaxID=210632 RepID=A0A6P7I9B3_9TELE|nr:granzyme B-like [Parambassis ranga]